MPKTALMLLLVAIALANLSAQSAGIDRTLVGTWTLVSTEEAIDSAEPSRVTAPRGLLVLDASGWMFEAITRDNRQRPTTAQASSSAGPTAVALHACGAAPCSGRTTCRWAKCHQ